MKFFEAKRDQNSGLERLSYIITILVQAKDIHAFTILQNSSIIFQHKVSSEILPLVVQLDPSRGHIFMQERQMKNADDQMYRDALSDTLLIISDNPEDTILERNSTLLKCFYKL